MEDTLTTTRPSSQSETQRALAFWHKVLTQCLKQIPYNLSTRQMGILLHVYMTQGPHSVKSLSADLNISKPAICRALDQLELHHFLKRGRDQADKRNVILKRTVKGSVFLSEFGDIIAQIGR